ncbi:hypothetical protein BG003_011764 [Podila horticola]|nr:hypothetical protein BG003_011764 [Podila horticola]
MAKLNIKKDKTRGWTIEKFMPESTIPTNGAHPMDISSNLDAISEDQEADLASGSNASTASSGNNNNNNNNNFRQPHSHSDNSNSSEEEINSDDDHDMEGNSTSKRDQHGNGSSSSNNDDDDDQEESEHSTTDESEEEPDHSQNGRLDIPKSKNNPRLKKKRASSLSTSPSDPSKVVSATPTKKITKKSKKSVKSKSSKGSLSTSSRQAAEEAKLEAAKPIVSRFLEMENTKLNDKLLQVFMINGMIPYVVETITRLDPEIAKEIQEDDNLDESQESKFMRRVEHCRRKRDYSDLNLMKKSYTAMNFFVRNDMYNEFILSNGHQMIVKELFKIFRPESNGNFHHFHKVFETILKKFRLQTMATLFEDADSETGVPRTPLIFEMLPFLDQPPVALALTKILFPTYAYGFSEKIQEYYRTLQRGHFLEMLLAMVTLTENSTTNMGDLVVSLLDEATRAKEAKIFLSCLADNPIWAERLVRGVQSSDPAKRHSCIEIIYSVLVRSIQMPFQDMFASSIYISDKSFDRVESHLERIANDFGKNLTDFIPELCQEFIGSKLSGGQVSLPGYSVPSSFTVGRLWLLDSIYHCLTDVKENPDLLESIPEQFWITLVDSFFQFRFNSAFHVQFYKIFRVALYSEQPTVYDRFYVKTGIVNRLIEHYLAIGQPTGTKGYIILILNCIRLSCDVEEQAAKNGATEPGFWTELLKDNAEWANFKPTLREATLEQTRDTLCQMDPNLRFQFAPLQARQPSEAPMTKRHFGIPGVSARGTDGIDLGSRYSNSLGFGVPMVYTRAMKEEDKERTEEDIESEVQRALEKLMPSMDWKLIPPQRVINAMVNANKGKGANGTNKAVADVETSNTGTTSDTNQGSGSTSSLKPKKKKKNKKKRQIASVHAEHEGEEGEDDDETERMKRIAITSEEDEDSDSSLSSGSNPSSANNSDVSGSEDEGSSSSSGSTNGSRTGSGNDSEEERKERKREKKREKKRKNRMNKKNKTEAVGGEAMEH